MSLGSVLQTSLTGVSAATLAVNAVSHNLANSRTAGFQASEPTLATQVPTTRQVGNAPDGNSSGFIQIGTGVKSTGFRTGLSQGQLIARADEFSSTDGGQNLVELTLASQQFRANAEVFGAAGRLLDLFF